MMKVRVPGVWLGYPGYIPARVARLATACRWCGRDEKSRRTRNGPRGPLVPSLIGSLSRYIPALIARLARSLGIFPLSLRDWLALSVYSRSHRAIGSLSRYIPALIARLAPLSQVVAEMMIAANAAVARRIYQSFPRGTILRRHAPPRTESMAAFTELLASVYVERGGPWIERAGKIDVSDNKALARTLREAKEACHPQMLSLLK
eukprot:467994-Pyramimonas_sp.AAC.1